MKSSQFPTNYFANCFSAKKMFLNRNELKVWQMILVTIFLIFVMLNPVAINANKSPELQLDSIMPNLMKALKESENVDFSAIQIKNDKLVETEAKQVTDSIYLNESKKDFEKVKTGLNFKEKTLEMKDKNGLVFELNYTDEWDFSTIDTTKAFTAWLTKEWNKQNAPYRILSMTFLVGVLVLSSTLFLIFGTSLFIWLTKKNHLSNIKSYKEAMNVTLNAMLLSTLVATIIGLIHYDISLMLMIQAFGLAIQILIIFTKTKFNDTLAVGGKLK